MEEDTIEFQSRDESGTLSIRADVRADSWNEEERSFEVVYATSTPVQQIDFKRWELVDEVLEISAEAIDTTRFDSGGIPFFDHHRQDGASGTYGICTAPRIENGQAIAKIRLSSREDKKLDGIAHDIKTGILNSFSAGYRVLEATRTEFEEGSGKRPLVNVTRWAPMEISVEPMPADHMARMRSLIKDKQEKPTTVEINTRSTPKTVTPPPVADSPAAQINTRKMDDQEVQQLKDKAAAEAIEAERKRGAEMTLMQRQLPGISEEFWAKHKNGNPDEVRKLAIEEFAKQDPNAGVRNITVGVDNADKKRQALEDAIYIRATGDESFTGYERKERPTDATKNERLRNADDFGSMPILRVAQEFLEDNGINTRHMDAIDIAKHALGVAKRAAGMETTDFGVIMDNTVNRSLMRRYQLAEPEWQAFTRENPSTDFRPKTPARMSDAPPMQLLLENAEVKFGPMRDQAESLQASKYGAGVSLSFETLINDDLNAFMDVLMALADQARNNESDIVYGILTSNPALVSDGVPLFHANHGNLIASASDLTVDTLSAGRALMRKQRSLSNKAGNAGSFINVTPEFLIVGPDREQKALQIVEGIIMANTTSNANIWRGKLRAIVDPRITNNDFYLLANPGRVNTIDTTYLRGRRLWSDTQINFGTLSRDYVVRQTFGAAPIDYRGAVKVVGN